jgi:asparagine synthase (glutamine-hydrolysing)
MCGFLFSNKAQDSDWFNQRLEEISFRGPDYKGYLNFEDLHFGHVRLSIIDLDSRSNQPFVYKNLTILYNGEIYNYKDVKLELQNLGYIFSTEGDTEVIIIGYKEWGSKVLEKLNGMFAFVIYDRETKQIFGARDRIGVKPLYYFHKENIFEVCSQLAPLKLSNSFTLNQEAISIYLDCRFIPAPLSVYNEVKKLEPGCFFEYSIGDATISITRYWDLNKVQPFKGSYDEAKKTLKNLLYDAVRIRLFSDVPIGSFLSSGIDSALISSIASDINEQNINTFTVGFSGYKNDESSKAQKYAEVLGTNHTTINCGPEDILNNLPMLIKVFDEPFGDNSALPTLLVNNKAKEFVTVALSGDGGDESFLGYGHYESIRKYKWIMNLPYCLRKIILIPIVYLKLFNERFSEALSVRKKNHFIYRKYSRLGLLLNKPFNQWFKKYDYLAKRSTSFLQFAADVNIKLWLEGDSNVKVDRASMAFGVEVRSPFLDYRIVEFARTLPIHYRLDKGVKKKILKDLLNEFIPIEIINQSKLGFGMPLENWIKNELKEEIISALSPQFFAQVPNLNKNGILQKLEEHLNGSKDHSDSIWRVFILAKWLERQ